MDIKVVAAPITGDKLYQRRARAALPILVRQAETRSPITYPALAQELEMPLARNLNHVLNSIGAVLEKLSEAWSEKVPALAALVVNKRTGHPGSGFDGRLIGRREFALLSLDKRQAYLDDAFKDIYAYGRWREVLEALSLLLVPTIR